MYSRMSAICSKLEKRRLKFLCGNKNKGGAINNSVEPKVKLGVQLTTVLVEDAGTTG